MRGARLALAAASLAAFAPAPGATAARPQVSTVATGLAIPWEIAFLPDRRALVTERPGAVRLLSARGKLQKAPVARIPVTLQGEGGLLGLAVDPAFARNHFVYSSAKIRRRSTASSCRSLPVSTAARAVGRTSSRWATATRRDLIGSPRPGG